MQPVHLPGLNVGLLIFFSLYRVEYLTDDQRVFDTGDDLDLATAVFTHFNMM